MLLSAGIRSAQCPISHGLRCELWFLRQDNGRFLHYIVTIFPLNPKNNLWERHLNTMHISSKIHPHPHRFSIHWWFFPKSIFNYDFFQRWQCHSALLCKKETPLLPFLPVELSVISVGLWILFPTVYFITFLNYFDAHIVPDFTNKTSFKPTPLLFWQDPSLS